MLLRLKESVESTVKLSVSDKSFGFSMFVVENCSHVNRIKVEWSSSRKIDFKIIPFMFTSQIIHPMNITQAIHIHDVCVEWKGKFVFHFSWHCKFARWWRLLENIDICLHSWYFVSTYSVTEMVNLESSAEVKQRRKKSGWVISSSKW